MGKKRGEMGEIRLLPLLFLASPVCIGWLLAGWGAAR